MTTSEQVAVSISAEDLERFKRTTEQVSEALRAIGESVGAFLREVARQTQPWLRKYHAGREWWLRHTNAAYARSLRNSPPWPGRGRYHPSTHNRRRNRHGRKGVKR